MDDLKTVLAPLAGMAMLALFCVAFWAFGKLIEWLSKH